MTFRFEGEYAEFEKILRGAEISQDELTIRGYQVELDRLVGLIRDRDKHVAECTEEIRAAHHAIADLRVSLEEKDAGLKAKDDQIAQLMRRLGQV